MPPAHNTAAIGTLPIEHTNVKMATSGPTSATADDLRGRRSVLKEQRAPHVIRHERRKRAGDQEADQQIVAQHPEIHRRRSARRTRSSVGSRNRCHTVSPSTRSSPCSCPLRFIDVRARLLDELARVREFDGNRHDRDEQHAADPFAGGELPPHEQPQDDAKLDARGWSTRTRRRARVSSPRPS